MYAVKNARKKKKKKKKSKNHENGCHLRVEWISLEASSSSVTHHIRLKLVMLSYKDPKFDKGGLRMIDPLIFSQAQKFIWINMIKQLLDPKYSSFGKVLEMSILENFYQDWTVLLRSNAPDSVLNTLSNCQLIEIIKLWYLYKNKILKNLGWSDFHLQDPIWWNKNVRLKTKKFFFFTLFGMKKGYILFRVFILAII